MKKAFTLVETLFVILVFGTGILAVLYGMTQTLGQSDRAKTQITSSFLAREGIELMYNLRDSNYRKKLPRNCLFQRVEGIPTINVANGEESKNPYCLDYFTGGMVLQLAIGSGNNYLLVKTGAIDETDFEKTFETFQLFYQT
jgi:hypothetical protein